SQIAGSTIRWAAAPRLDLLASAAGQDLGGDLGAFGFVRGTLRLDDEGDGSLGLEVRRQDVAFAHWSGVRMILAESLAAQWRASSELEIARADDTEGRSTVFPWGLAALGWHATSGWEAAAAVEAGSTPKYRFEVEGLVRISYAWSHR